MNHQAFIISIHVSLCNHNSLSFIIMKHIPKLFCKKNISRIWLHHQDAKALFAKTFGVCFHCRHPSLIENQRHLPGGKTGRTTSLRSYGGFFKIEDPENDGFQLVSMLKLSTYFDDLKVLPTLGDLHILL